MSDSPFDAVCTVLRATLELDDEVPIEPDTRLDVLPNSDSLRLLRTVSILERTYDIELDDAAIFRAETVADLAEIISKEVLRTAS